MKTRLESLCFAFGALPHAERMRLTRARLSDPALDARIAHDQAMFAPLAGTAGEMCPPPSLRARVMAAVSRASDYLNGGKQLNRFAAGRWKQVLPGVEMKRLWPNGPKLMRCAASSHIPAHDHDGIEHLVVLSGDFALDGRLFELGDHLFSPHGSQHGTGFTEAGCVLLIYNN